MNKKNIVLLIILISIISISSRISFSAESCKITLDQEVRDNKIVYTMKLDGYVYYGISDDDWQAYLTPPGGSEFRFGSCGNKDWAICGVTGGQDTATICSRGKDSPI